MPRKPRAASKAQAPPPGSHDVSAAEEAARAAEPGALTDEEKASLAAEVSRIEDA